MSSPRPRYLSNAEISEIYDIPVGTLYRWVSKGWIEPHLRTSGGQYRWDPDRFEEDMRAVYVARSDERARRQRGRRRRD